MDRKVEQEIKTVKNEINDLYIQEIQKKLFFLKQKYWEVGGKSSKLLAYRLKKKQADSALYKLMNPETKVTEYKQERIQHCLLAFYQKLYSQPQLDNDPQINTFLNSIQLPSFTETQNDILRGEITLKEINLAIT